jgi:hypothetical protein
MQRNLKSSLLKLVKKVQTAVVCFSLICFHLSFEYSKLKAQFLWEKWLSQQETPQNGRSITVNVLSSKGRIAVYISEDIQILLKRMNDVEEHTSLRIEWEAGGSRFLQNVCVYLTIYMVSNPIKH